MLCRKTYILWRTPGIFSRRKEIFTMVFQFQCAILIYLFLSWYILSLLVLCKNYMRKCFNHFYKIKICKSVKNHPWNLKKTKIAIYGFQKYAQKNLFSSFSIMFKPGFDYVLSTPSPAPLPPPLNHGLIWELWFKEVETPLSWVKRLNGLAVNAQIVANNAGNRYLLIFHAIQNNRNDLREWNQSNYIS